MIITFTRQLCVHTVLATQESRGQLPSNWVTYGAHLVSARTLTNDLLHAVRTEQPHISGTQAEINCDNNRK